MNTSKYQCQEDAGGELRRLIWEGSMEVYGLKRLVLEFSGIESWQRPLVSACQDILPSKDLRERVSHGLPEPEDGEAAGLFSQGKASGWEEHSEPSRCHLVG